MYKARHQLLINKATTYIDRINSKEYTPDGKAAFALLYQIDTMIYGLASIDSSVWQSYLKTFKETKYLLRTHSRDENVKMENYNKALATVLQTLEKYIEYLQSTLTTEVA